MAVESQMKRALMRNIKSSSPGLIKFSPHILHLLDLFACDKSAVLSV